MLLEGHKIKQRVNIFGVFCLPIRISAEYLPYHKVPCASERELRFYEIYFSLLFICKILLEAKKYSLPLRRAPRGLLFPGACKYDNVSMTVNISLPFFAIKATIY